MSNVTITNVTKEFAGGIVKGVDDVSLEIAEGSFVTLLGPSGSGKTTTLRMIAGLETPTRGSIAIGGRTVFGPHTNVPTHQRNIGMVFQSYAVWPHMTVYDNVAFPLAVKRDRSPAERHKAVSNIIELVDLSGLEKRLPAELSGGQQQRVALARALVAQPAVLLFDEPLSNLDAKLRESMRLLIKELHGQLKTTAVYVTHDQLEAIWLSDVIHVMSKGKVVQSGSPQEIYDAPVSLFVAEFVGQANVFGLTSADPATGCVVTGLGILHVDNWPTGHQPSHVLIRYNNVRLLPAGAPISADRRNVIPARLSNIQFIGDRYQLEAVAGENVRITTHVDRLSDVSKIGQEVLAILPREHIRPLSR